MLAGPARMASSKQLVFFRRLGSSVALWAVALWIILSGFEIGFFFLIGTLGMLGLWEFYRMLDHKQLPNFKMLALICGVIFLSGSFYYFSRVGPARSYDFEVSVMLFFLLIVFARQMFQRTRDIRPLETMAYTLFGLLLRHLDVRFRDEDRLPLPAECRRARDRPILRALSASW